MKYFFQLTVNSFLSIWRCSIRPLINRQASAVALSCCTRHVLPNWSSGKAKNISIFIYIFLEFHFLSIIQNTIWQIRKPRIIFGFLPINWRTIGCVAEEGEFLPVSFVAKSLPTCSKSASSLAKNYNGLWRRVYHSNRNSCITRNVYELCRSKNWITVT